MASKIMTCNRTLIPGLKCIVRTVTSSRNSSFNFSNIMVKRKTYNEKKLVGFSMEQMFAVVSDVANYKNFVPFCKKSIVHSQQLPNFLKADLIIGFPPLNESYTSHVTLEKPNLVRAECLDGKLFNYLLNLWKFSPGLKDIEQSCVIDFHVAFEFKSIIHTQLSLLFFDQLVKQMEEAFVREAQHRYGEPVIKSHILMTTKT